MTYYMLIKPATGEIMAVDHYGPSPFDPKTNRVHSPKLIPSLHLAENYQSAMNCDHGSGWEIAILDLTKVTVAVTETESE